MLQPEPCRQCPHHLPAGLARFSMRNTLQHRLHEPQLRPGTTLRSTALSAATSSADKGKETLPSMPAMSLIRVPPIVNGGATYLSPISRRAHQPRLGGPASAALSEAAGSGTGAGEGAGAGAGGGAYDDAADGVQDTGSRTVDRRRGGSASAEAAEAGAGSGAGAGVSARGGAGSLYGSGRDCSAGSP